MTRVSRYYQNQGIKLWIICMLLAFGGLFGLVNAHAFDLVIQTLGGGPISEFTYLINEDNTNDPFDPDPMQHPGVAPMASHSPIVAAGRQDTASGINLPPGRYLISVRATDYKLWGRHIRVGAGGQVFDADGNDLDGTVTIELRPASESQPLPLSKLEVQVFEDFRIADGFPDFPHEVDANGSVTNMPNFHVVLSDGTGQVVVDWFGNPICGTGKCLTNNRGKVTIPNLAHGKYEITAIPATGSGWVQTTTFEGTKVIDAWLQEGNDGLGLNEAERKPGVPTTHYVGFVTTTGRNTLGGGTGTITGTVKNLVAFPPEVESFGEPVVRPWIAVTDLRTDTLVKVVRGDTLGRFTITGVPAGLYQLMIFDEFLHYINGFYTVRVQNGKTASPGGDPSCTTPSVNCRVGLARWFGMLSGYVFLDSNKNAKRDAGEVGISNVEVGTAFRDGSRDKTTVSKTGGSYELPAVLSPLLKMLTIEVGFTNFGITGHAAHREQYANFNQRDPSPTVVDPELGGGLILSQAIFEGKRAIVDWGKIPYTGTQNGGITGRVLYAVTRNEYEARYAAAEDYEPGIPNVTVRLYGLGADGQPNTADDVLLNEIQTDSWQMPRTDNPNNPVQCDVLDQNGSPLTGPGWEFIADHCTEVPALGNETQPGAYDGGWAIDSMCPPTTPTPANPTGSTYPCDEADLISPLPPATYVVEVVPPPFYQIVKEEDNNTLEGNPLAPLIPPPPCVGDLHTVPAVPGFPDFPFTGQNMPLCDKRMVTLQARQNPGFDSFLFTTDAPYEAPLPPSTARSSWTSAQAVPPPGRFFGLVEDDVKINLDPNSVSFAEKLGVAGLPVGIYEFGEGGNAVGRRLITVYTDELGFYEVLLPSTATTSTPIPGGVSPAMYVVVINDPGDLANPNLSFSKGYVTFPFVYDVWPGKMTPLDTAILPINRFVCGLPPDAPQLTLVSTPVVTAGVATNITITGTGFGNRPGLSNAPIVTLNGVSLTVVSWTPGNPESVVVATVPASFPAGPAQLLVTAGPILDGPGGGQVSRNGLTIHVLGGAYNPPVVNVSPPAVPGDPAIQPAIDSAAPGSLIVVAPGNYHENVILHKNVKLQGHGPGGTVSIGVEPPTLSQGTVIDGRYFRFVEGKRTAWLATLSGPASPYSGPATVPTGAAITVVAADGEFGPEGGLAEAAAPRIDGFGIITGRGEAGGGIYVHAFGRNLIISNNILEANQGRHGGGISIGQPVATSGLADQQNDNIRMHHNRILDSGGVFLAGAVGIFGGADNYRFDHNDVCGGFSAEYGGCFSHWGLSDGAKIEDNRFYYCDAVDEGGGVLIAGDPTALPPLGEGSGLVHIERNLIQSNLSWDDGGGIRLLRTLTDRVNIRNNIIVNNVAADHGGGIALDDASDVVIVNNTIAGNVSTQTAEDSTLGQARGAGITSERHSAVFVPGDGSAFSDPVLFNNIIWDNLAYRWNGTGLVPTAYIDLEVIDGLPGQCMPVRYSFLSGAYSCTGSGNNIVANGGNAATKTPPAPSPGFIDPLNAGQVDIQVGPGRFNPAELFPTLNRPLRTLVGFTDYHVQVGPNPAQDAIDAGTPSRPATATQPAVSAPTNDFDGDARPQGAGFDMGADERVP